MDREEFVRNINRRYVAEGLPLLDCRDLPELVKSGVMGNEPAERDAGNPAIRGFLEKKQEKIAALVKERACTACGKEFVPAEKVVLYLYSEMVIPPPEGYCPECLERIQQQLASREGAENMRCCG